MLNFKPDACISDMDPLVSLMGFNHNIPVISFDNQHSLTNLNIQIPNKFLKEFIITKTYIKKILIRRDFTIITSFSNEDILKKNTFIVPLVIRKEVLNIKPEKTEKILVYFSGKDKTKLKILKKISKNFLVYGFDIEKTEKNLKFKKNKDFLEDLGKCKAIIATAGFSLISEALYLKKPYLALPLKNHLEQYLNAIFLRNNSFGEFSEKLSKKDVDSFLSNLPKYNKNLKKYNFNNEEVFKTFDKVLKKIKSYH